MLKEQGVGDWLELAKQYSVKELETLVKDSKAGFDIDATGGDKIVTMTFKMTPESSEIVNEALDTAKKIAETNDNVLALEQMSYDYVMGQGADPEKMTLESLVSFAERNYGVEIQVVDRADVSELLQEETEVNEDALGKIQG
jgi:hypothetical protein